VGVVEQFTLMMVATVSYNTRYRCDSVNQLFHC